MKLKDGFILQEVAGVSVVVPVGDDLDLNMMITMNETGGFLWKRLAQGTDAETLVADLLSEYDVEEAQARKDVAAFVAKLDAHGILA